MRRYGKQFWRSVPFIRLLIPFVAGIIIMRYCPVSLGVLSVIAILSFTMGSAFRLIPRSSYYRWRWINGMVLNVLMFCLGCCIMYSRTLSNDRNWIGLYAGETGFVSATLSEPLTQKTNSYKTVAAIQCVRINDEWKPACGNLLLYFKKDSIAPSVTYGAQIIIQKKLQRIVNSGNPGAFDYKQYCAFRGTDYQVYLQPGDWIATGLPKKDRLTELLIAARENVLSIFRKYVPGEKEAGVAEALLIGYRDDLDKDLVRSYSNTGVVHIIAISGLHLGMIYGLMLVILSPFRRWPYMRWIRPLLILLVLWGFTLLAGAAASILRSVVMFSFIVVGESIGRKTNIYNTLAASAFCLLLYDPSFFWDVGFQLSYAAVVSIVLFMKPVYQNIYCKNKILDMIWQLNAITIAAQVLTLPIILYYFHQFPNLFLFTNFIAVPLSGFILYGELLLLVVYKVPFVNIYTGKIISWLIFQLNSVIERTDRLPFSVTDHIQVSLAQTILLYLAISFAGWWLLLRKKNGMMISLCCFCIFFLLHCIRRIQQSQQQKMIIYHIPKYKAIDVMEGHDHVFTGDSAVSASLQDYHLLPARIKNGVVPKQQLKHTIVTHTLIAGANKTALIIDRSFRLPSITNRIPVDIIILSGNPNTRITGLAVVFNCKQWVFDSSNPLWKIRYWKKDADSLHLRHHTIAEQGAFEADL